MHASVELADGLRFANHVFVICRHVPSLSGLVQSAGRYCIIIGSLRVDLSHLTDIIDQCAFISWETFTTEIVLHSLSNRRGIATAARVGLGEPSFWFAKYSSFSASPVFVGF